MFCPPFTACALFGVSAIGRLHCTIIKLIVIRLFICSGRKFQASKNFIYVLCSRALIKSILTSVNLSSHVNLLFHLFTIQNPQSFECSSTRFAEMVYIVKSFPSTNDCPSGHTNSIKRT